MDIASLHYKTEPGFTIVEMIVSIVVVNLFLALFFQTYILMESQRISVARQARASDIAYSNLRKFTTRPAGLTCDSTMEAGGSGKLLGDQTNTGTSSTYGFIAEPTSVTQSLGSNSTQQVRVFVTGSCADFATKPLKIISIVTYGTGNNDKVVHASYIE